MYSGSSSAILSHSFRLRQLRIVLFPPSEHHGSGPTGDRGSWRQLHHSSRHSRDRPEVFTLTKHVIMAPRVTNVSRIVCFTRCNRSEVTGHLQTGIWHRCLPWVSSTNWNGLREVHKAWTHAQVHRGERKNERRGLSARTATSIRTASYRRRSCYETVGEQLCGVTFRRRDTSQSQDHKHHVSFDCASIPHVCPNDRRYMFCMATEGLRTKYCIMTNLWLSAQVRQPESRLFARKQLLAPVWGKWLDMYPNSQGCEFNMLIRGPSGDTHHDSAPHEALGEIPQMPGRHQDRVDTAAITEMKKDISDLAMPFRGDRQRGLRRSRAKESSTIRHSSWPFITGHSIMFPSVWCSQRQSSPRKSGERRKQR